MSVRGAPHLDLGEPCPLSVLTWTRQGVAVFDSDRTFRPLGTAMKLAYARIERIGARMA
jgi:hypothetical protein